MRALRKTAVLLRAVRLLQEEVVPRVPEVQQERDEDEAPRHMQDVLDEFEKTQKLFVRVKPLQEGVRVLEKVAPGVFFLRGWEAFDNISSNCFFLKNKGSLLLIDCGNLSEQTAKELNAAIKELKGAVKAVYCTHGHYDHVGGIKALPSKTPVFLSEKDFYLIHGEGKARFKPLKKKIVFGSFALSVLPTPGHTPGSVCFWEARKKILFSGDTLFAAGAFGRTDFEGGDQRAMERSLKTLGGLGWRVLLPGHDDVERA